MGRKTKNAKKAKVNLVFDSKSRSEFLRGFHKRKVKRKDQFKEDLKQMMKKERTKIRQQTKASIKNMIMSHRSIPEVDHLINEQHDLGSHSVEIKELSKEALTQENFWIGENQTRYDQDDDDDDDDKEEEEKNIKPENLDDSDSEIIPGMSLVDEKPVKVIAKKQTAIEKPQKDKPSPFGAGKVFRTVKDIKKAMKSQSAQQVKESKAYKLNNKLQLMESRKGAKHAHKVLAKFKERSKKGKAKKKNIERKMRYAARRDTNKVIYNDS